MGSYNSPYSVMQFLIRTQYKIVVNEPHSLYTEVACLIMTFKYIILVILPF